jgi:hypothetical protein
MTKQFASAMAYKITARGLFVGVSISTLVFKSKGNG